MSRQLMGRFKRYLVIDWTYTSQTSELCAINTIQSFSELSATQKIELKNVINMFEKIGPTDKLGRTHLITHSIDTGDIHPMSKATSRSIIKFLENHVFLIYGCPQIFACDNGTQFTSKEFTHFIESYRIKLWLNARYHPQINHTERVNRIIVTAIRSYIHGNHKTWDVSIYKVAQAIRLAKHDVTGYSPAFLTFGRNIPLTGDYYGQVSENANNVVTISEENQLIEDLQELPKVWKRNYTLSSKANDYSAKLSAKYIPCVVVKVMSNLVYKLKDTNGVDLGNWHVKDLKPDHRNLDSDDESGPASSSDSDNHDI
ncbi:hypothetical protein NQ317_010772 [Molorchus minor]|uniref:Integrase catalytic domain-containing protein n=1 Tax=Molorchus minor TaxID=1323400 RepID=A0ABQ9J9G3_9CUCU|nr:hypothetical protein NQ317_010772 [Molorchus minor]